MLAPIAMWPPSPRLVSSDDFFTWVDVLVPFWPTTTVSVPHTLDEPRLFESPAYTAHNSYVPEVLKLVLSDRTPTDFTAPIWVPLVQLGVRSEAVCFRK